MIIDYYLINPTENITILVESPVPREVQPFVAVELLKIEKRGEQVGFIEKSENCDISVRMAGGEFCGNAAISAAALYQACNGEKESIGVLLSGTPVTVKKLYGNDKFSYSAYLKNNAHIGEISFEYKNNINNLPIISVFGISHIIADKSKIDFAPEDVIKTVCKKAGTQALGIMIFDFKSNTLKPLVYVPQGDTLYWENSCASGTAAVGAYLFNKFGKKISLDINEPGGVLNITADKTSLVLSGNAIVEYKKQADISI